jgi:hypothetical protein
MICLYYKIVWGEARYFGHWDRWERREKGERKGVKGERREIV